ncbi:type II toxin-antitoxin system RelE/ParE family toxin [Patescibacteria group bacterium]|nr:type II toxin-antitoxin system RelE/ParE family toxin [Patescibacteria group bacterium]
MPYSLIYTSSSVKDIKKLDRITKKRLKKKLELLAANPLHYSKKLIHSDLGTYRYRVGNHRVIFDLEKNNIIVLRIGHRREIYR